MEPAADHSPETLTARQLDCMLLVKEGLSSKQIARELGISPRTVDQHVAAAVEALGVANRMAAISRLCEWARTEDPPQADPPFMLGEASNGDEMHVLREASNLDETDVFDSTTHLRAPAILPPLGGAVNAASRSERSAWIVRIAVFCTMLACAGILTILGVSEMVESFER